MAVVKVQSFVTGGGPITPPITPTPGNLMIIAAATRTTGGGPGGISGWNTVSPGVLTTTAHHARDHAMFWRVAESGDTSFLTGGTYTQTVFTFMEFSGTSSVVDAEQGTIVGNTNAVVCGGAITTSIAALIIGGCAADFTNDTETMSTAPSAGVTEVSDKGGASASPGYWTAYRVEAAAGTYTVGGTATMGSGGTTHGMAGHTIAFLVAAPPVADFTSDVDGGNAPTTVNFTDTSTNDPTSWAWDFGDGGTSTSQNPSHIYATPGAYTVSLTATNADGSDTETKTAYINVLTAGGFEPPPPAGVLLEIYAADPGSFRWGVAKWGQATWGSSSWQDVTPEGVDIQILWGAQDPEMGILSLPTADSWSITFYDPHRRLDPANADGPFYTDLLPYLPVRVSHRERVIALGYAESIGHQYAKSTGNGYMRVTNNVSRLANARVPSDTTLSDTLYTRAQDAITAAGLSLAVGAVLGTDPPLVPWAALDPVPDWSAWDWIVDAGRQCHYIPFVNRRTGILEFRPWAAPLSRGRSINSPELVDLQVISEYRGLFSVIRALDDSTPPGTIVERAIIPPPRYGARVFERSDPTLDAGAWAEIVLADRANGGLRWVPGTVYPLTADSVETLNDIGYVELISMAVPEQSPPVSATAIVVGGEINITAKREDEAVWRFLFETAQTAVEPLIETGGAPTDYLLATGGGEFLYPST